jgi:nitrite reductase (NO-forming)
MSTIVDRLRPVARSVTTTFTPLMSVITTAAVIGLVVGLIAVGLVGSGSSAASGGDASLPGAGQTVSFDIELGDTYVSPSSIEIPAGATVELNVTNVGAMEHNLGLEGDDDTDVPPGETRVLNWGPIATTTQAWCTVAGHKDAGMVLDIVTVGGPATGGGGAEAASNDGGTAGASIDPAATPSDDWEPFDPAVAPAPGGTTHEVTLRVKEGEIEVAPGVTQEMWTYGDSAPGPVLRGKVGDLFKVTLVNDGTIAHSIDFHASKVAPNDEMRPLEPGESLVYEFKANHAGAWTYHCGVDPMIHHMGNGMFGAVIVDPPDLAPVDEEFVLVQSELNLGPEGEPGDLNKMMTGANDAVVFNGYHNQYVHSPLAVDPGDRVRVWLVDAAINEDLAFHVVGSIFDTVWKEGAYTLRPDDAERGGSQTLDLQPTQGGFVELSFEEPGTYTFVNHKMRNLSRGAAGVFVVGDGGEGDAD